MMGISKIGFVILFALVFILVVLTYRGGLLRLNISKPLVNKRVGILGAVILIWITYLYFLGESGFIWEFSFPPRFLLCIFLPLFLIATVIFVKNKNSGLYQTISKERVIYFQSFRIIVELLISATFYAGIFPIETTFEGYNFEIIIAIVAPIIGFAVYRKGWIPEWWAILFNIAGLITLGIIIFIVITSLFFPSFWGDSAPQIKEEFSQMPYLLLPGFLAPIAVFTHVFSIIQIRKSRRESVKS